MLLEHETNLTCEPSPVVSRDDPGPGANGFLLLADGASFLLLPNGFRLTVP